MPVLKPAPVSTAFFHFNRSTSTFSAEESTLRANGFRGFGRVFDDACDIGFTMVSIRTGREVVFAQAGEDRDREGDLRFWTFKSLDGVYTATVFND